MPAVTIPDTGSTTLLAANYERKTLLISHSAGTGLLHIAFGETATTNHSFIRQGGTLTLSERVFKGAINAISSSGNITAKYSEEDGS